MHFDTSSVVSSAVFSSCLRGLGVLRRGVATPLNMLHSCSWGTSQIVLKWYFFLEKPADQRTHKCVDPPMFHTESNKIVVFGRCAVRIADSDETWRTDPCEKHSKNWPPTWIQNFGWLAADLGLNPLAAALPALVLWSGTFLGSYVVNRVLPTRLVECSNFKCRSDQYYEHCSRSILPREFKKN